MTFDPKTLAALATFAESLPATEGEESYEDILRQREEAKANAKARLVQRIAEIEQQIKATREKAHEEALKQEHSNNEQYRRISTMTFKSGSYDTQRQRRNDALREFERNCVKPEQVFSEYMRAIRQLERTLRELKQM